MPTAVRELVHRVQREGVELVQLAHAGEMEEAVAADLAGDLPEQEAEHDAGGEDPPAAGDELGSWCPARERRGDDGGREEQHERQRQRRACDEGDRQRAEDERRATRRASPRRPGGRAPGR